MWKTITSVLLGTSVLASAATAQDSTSYNVYGLPGLIQMPTAESAPDAELAFGFSSVGDTLHSAITFQITPKLSGTFRYTKISDTTFGTRPDYYDRSFDVRYRFNDEGTYLPAFAIGLRDFAGTGLFSSEYLVATKTFGKVSATAGIGWGRLGSYNSFSNPLGAISSSFDARPTTFASTGGQIESAKWFRGDAALFGGLKWDVNEKLTLAAEYSSDAQDFLVANNGLDRKSPLNFGVDYKLGRQARVGAYYAHGSEIGAMLTLVLDPKGDATNLSRESAPVPVVRRAAGSARDLGWTSADLDTQASAYTSAINKAIKSEGLRIDGIALSPRQAVVRVENKRFQAQSQAIGRVARVLATVLPASVETFVIVPMVGGLPGSKVTISRTNLENYEFAPNAADLMRASVDVSDAADVNRWVGRDPDRKSYRWALKPYFRASLFDPDNPIALYLGARAEAEWNPAPGLHFSGAVEHQIATNADNTIRYSNSVLPHVRSDTNLYYLEGETALDHLTMSYMFRPGRNLYGRVTAGYLERQFGGVSTEVLWKPVNSRLAIGAELNVLKRRSFDGGFDFKPQSVNATLTGLGPVEEYNVVSGHVSAYYKFNNGFHGQLDVGRYLAKDWGATVSLDREFANGWRVGAFATKTNVSAAQFGEGSFDKGIRITIPLDWQIGQPSRRKSTSVIRPLLRDGGARVEVQDRLYELVRDTHTPALEQRWDRFWR